MQRKGLARDALIFIIIVIFLIIVIPAISSLLKQLFFLQAIIVLAGAIALRVLVNKIRGKMNQK
jgi:hypothetical protein